METLLEKKDQIQMLDGILHWLNANIEKFQIPIEAAPSTCGPEEITADIKRKAFSELGLAIRLAQRSPFLQQHPEMKKLQKSWVDIIDSQDFFFDTRRRLQLYPHRVVAYSVLRSLGIENDAAKSDLQAVLDRGFMENAERNAWEKLDMKYYIKACGLNHKFPSDEYLLKYSSLTNLPNLAYVQNLDLYGLTHLLFHFADFGDIDMKQFLQQDYQHIQDYTDLSLSMSVVKQDWDLTAELLINQYCLQKTFSEFDRHAAATLLKAQQTSGFIPGREWVIAQKTETEPASHIFEDVYHPTIVSLILLDCELMN